MFKHSSLIERVIAWSPLFMTLPDKTTHLFNSFGKRSEPFSSSKSDNNLLNKPLQAALIFSSPQTAAHINFAVTFSSRPSGLLHVVSTSPFIDSKISCSIFLRSTAVSFFVPAFESLHGFREVFPRLSAIFLERARERGVNYVTLLTKLDWSVIFSSHSKYGTCENEYSRASDKANI